MRAAEVATILGDRESLLTLTTDATANVRTTAAEGLFSLDGRGADSVLIALLDDSEPRLLTTLSLLLGESRSPDVLPALLGAFDNISQRVVETTRETRLVLLGEIFRRGAYENAGARLEPYLADFDPVVAERIADILREWTGRTVSATPGELPLFPLPYLPDMRIVENTDYRVDLRDGSSFTLRLFPFEAPRNAMRFARAARDGLFDGLVFHEAIPLSLIEGGSPRANSFSRHDLILRKEAGRIGNWAGTVTTRGDGLFIVNLADNLGEDGEITVFGEVIEGRDVPGRIMEGMVIEGVVRVPVDRRRRR
jgi:cyclophilin family peptidyl-prolyl cis-trans isomerase